jgi:hypothetical protein
MTVSNDQFDRLERLVEGNSIFSYCFLCKIYYGI